MIVIDSRDKRPIYEQVVDKLSDLMLVGVLSPGDKLPSVREGYVYSVKGIGSFVSDMDKIKENKKNVLFNELRELVDKSKRLIDRDEFCKKADEFYKKKEEV